MPNPPQHPSLSLDDLHLCRAVVSALGEAVLVTGPDLERPGPVIQYVNPAFTRITGYAPEEVVGQTPRLLQGTTSERAELDRLEADLRATGTFNGKTTNYKKDGTAYINEWVITAVRDDRGEVLHWVSVQRDVTERERQEEERRLLLSELQHRVRNAMSIIASVTRATSRRGADLETVAARIAGRVDAIGITQRLLTGDPSAGVDLANLVRSQVQGAGIDLQAVVVEGARAQIKIDAAQTLGLAFHELASNAVAHGAFAADGGELAIRWERVRGEAGDERIVVTWAEEKLGKAPILPERPGVGLELLEHALSYSLAAEITLSSGADFYRCVIDLPTRIEALAIPGRQ